MCSRLFNRSRKTEAELEELYSSKRHLEPTDGESYSSLADNDEALDPSDWSCSAFTPANMKEGLEPPCSFSSENTNTQQFNHLLGGPSNKGLRLRWYLLFLWFQIRVMWLLI